MRNDTTAVHATFRKAVNMTAEQLEAWLETTESRSVGIKIGTANQKVTGPQDGESTGHASGRMIVELLRMTPEQFDSEDYRQMKRVIGFINRHLAQPPRKPDTEQTRWRYSLMNWGHDPLKTTR